YGLTTEKILALWGTSTSARALTVVALGFVAWAVVGLLLRRRDPLFIGLGVFLVLISPNLGIVPFIFQNISTVADRYLYLPSAALAFVCALGVFRLQQSRRWSPDPRWARFAIAAIALALVVPTRRQVVRWEKSSTILAAGLEIAPESFPLW